MASGVPVVARDEGGPSEIVANGKSGYLVPPSDLDGFVEKVLKLGDQQLRQMMSVESRRMAEEATWEKINNRVAWKLAEALESRPAPVEETVSSLSVPIYSWLLLSPELKGFLRSLIVDCRLVAGLGVIVGVWAGLVVTWGLVQLTLMVKGRAPWLSDLIRGVSR